MGPGLELRSTPPIHCLGHLSATGISPTGIVATAMPTNVIVLRYILNQT